MFNKSCICYNLCIHLCLQKPTRSLTCNKYVDLVKMWFCLFGPNNSCTSSICPLTFWVCNRIINKINFVANDKKKEPSSPGYRKEEGFYWVIIYRGWGEGQQNGHRLTAHVSGLCFFSSVWLLISSSRRSLARTTWAETGTTVDWEIEIGDNHRPGAERGFLPHTDSHES